MKDPQSEALRAQALDYHAQPKPGKLEIRATKPLANGRDLARAYSPGVAEASKEIHANPDAARCSHAAWLKRRSHSSQSSGWDTVSVQVSPRSARVPEAGTRTAITSTACRATCSRNSTTASRRWSKTSLIEACWTRRC